MSTTHVSRSGTLAAWALFALVLGAPLIVWLVSVGDPREYFAHELPPGQRLYVIAKLAGLMALCVFWLQCVLGMAQRAPVLRSLPAPSLKVHRGLGLTTLLLVLSHVGLFVTAASLRTGKFAYSVLIPNFAHGYYASFVSLGVIALCLLLLGVYAGWRTSRGHKQWAKAHRVWLVVFALAFLHAFAIGTESRMGAMRYVVIFLAATLVAAVVSRVLAAWSARKSGFAMPLGSRA